jgi:hypothetical protein
VLVGESTDDPAGQALERKSSLAPIFEQRPMSDINTGVDALNDQEIAMSVAIEPFDVQESISASPLASPIQLCLLQCHYCSFEPADQEHLPKRCPKCGGSAWERYLLRGGLLLIAGDGESARVEFNLHCPAICAYLVGNFSADSPQLIEMTHTAPDDWSTTLSLAPGKYAYRFYLHDGRLVFFVAPAASSSSKALGHSFVVPQRRDPAERGGGTPRARRKRRIHAPPAWLEN